MGLVIVDSVTPTQMMGVDATPRAGRVILYGPDGNPVSAQNSSAVVPLTQGGVINAGRDYKLARVVRASPDGTLRTADDSLYLYDAIEGAAVDTNKWVQTTTTMTITQAVGTGTLFNAGSSVAATVGAMHVSHRRFAFIPRSSIAFRTRLRATAHFVNNIIECGLVNPPATATTAIVPDGFFWRKTAAGDWFPVISIAGVEFLGTAITNATYIAAVATTDYAHFAVFVEESRATYRIVTSAGAIVGTEQIIDFSNFVGAGTLAVTHLAAFLRNWNSGATGTAVQLFVTQTAVVGLDSISQRPWDASLSAMGHGSLTNPLTTFAQLANYANSAAPASAALSNVAAGYTTLGGQWQFAAVAGAETDYALFGFTNPSPYTLMVRRVSISAFNMVVAVAGTVHSLQWGLGFNSSAVSLATAAPYTPMRKTIGQMFALVAAPVGAGFSNSPVVWEGLEPVFPGRFFHIILKMPTATATATQIIRGTATVEGYFDG